MFALYEQPDVRISHQVATFDIADRRPPCRRQGTSIRSVVLDENKILGAHKALPGVQLLTIACQSRVCVQLVDGENNSLSTRAAQQQCCAAVPLEFMPSSTIVLGGMVQIIAVRLACYLFGSSVVI